MPEAPAIVALVLLGLALVFGLIVPLAWRAGYRAGNRDGLKGLRQAGLVMVREGWPLSEIILRDVEERTRALVKARRLVRP